MIALAAAAASILSFTQSISGEFTKGYAISPALKCDVL